MGEFENLFLIAHNEDGAHRLPLSTLNRKLQGCGEQGIENLWLGNFGYNGKVSGRNHFNFFSKVQNDQCVENGRPWSPRETDQLFPFFDQAS